MLHAIAANFEVTKSNIKLRSKPTAHINDNKDAVTFENATEHSSTGKLGVRKLVAASVTRTNKIRAKTTTQVDAIKNRAFQADVSDGGWILKRKVWGLEDGSPHDTPFPSIPEYIATDKDERAYVKKNIGDWSERTPHDTLYLALPDGNPFSSVTFEDHDTSTPLSNNPFQILVTLTMDVVTITANGSGWFPTNKSLSIQRDQLALSGCTVLPVAISTSHSE